MATIRWSNGRKDQYPTMTDALAAIEREYPDMVTVEEHDRTLVWANEEEAGPEGMGDTGVHAIASVVEHEWRPGVPPSEER